MHIFSSSNTVRPDKVVEATAFSIDVAGFISSASGLDFHAWQVIYGDSGVITWSSVVDSPAALTKATADLPADPAYHKLLARGGQLFSASPSNQIAEVVASAGAKAEVGEFAVTATAQYIPDRAVDAFEWSIDMMKHLAGLSGLSHTFMRGLYGLFGTLSWVTLADSMEEIDAHNAAQAEDPGFNERIAKAGDLFVANSGSQVLTRRLT